jgi:tetratricopeptide (TPR) repeat protein
LAKKNVEQKVSTQVKSISVRIFAIFSFLIAFLFYGNSISNGYSLDDELVTTTDRKHHENVEKGIGGIKAIFTSNYAIDGKQNYEYRPIVTLSYAIEWSLFSDHPERASISHFVNVLLYAICGILLFQLINVLFQGRASYFSAFVVALFMIHPIHSEVVNNLKNRDELLSLIFALLAAIQAFKYIDKGQLISVFIGLGFITLSILSKKSNLPFVILVPIMIYFFREVSWKKIGIVFSVLILTQVIFKIIKVSLLKEENVRLFNYVENPLYEMGFIDRIPVFIYTNYLYIQKLFVPYPLGYYYGFNMIPILTFSDWSFYLSLILILGLGVFAIYGLFKKSYYAFGILFFFIAIGGTANLLTPMVGIFAERFVFTASIAFCFIVVLLLYKVLKIDLFYEKSNIKLYASIAVIALPSLIFTLNRNKDWKSKKSLYVADSNYLKNSAKSNSLLGSEMQTEAYALKKEGIYRFAEMMQKVDSALLFYNRSLALYGTYESNLNNRGALYYEFYFDYLESIKSFKKSTDFNDSYYEGMLNIGNSYCKLAEGYENMLKLLPPTNSTELKQLSKIDKIYRERKIYRALGLLRQFEVNAIALLKSGLNTNTVNTLIVNAKNLESLDPILKNLDFSTKVSTYLTNILATKQRPSIEFIQNFRIQIIRLICVEQNVSDLEFRANAEKLKKSYIDSAKVYFDKTYQLKPKLESYYSSLNGFAMSLSDYNMLIDIQLKYLKHFKSKYNAPQYIQLANAYYSLGNSIKAKEYFKKGMSDLQKERADLIKKTPKTTEEDSRIIALESEITRLTQFVQNLKQLKQLKQKNNN